MKNKHKKYIKAIQTMYNYRDKIINDVDRRLRSDRYRSFSRAVTQKL